MCSCGSVRLSLNTLQRFYFISHRCSSRRTLQTSCICAGARSEGVPEGIPGKGASRPGVRSWCRSDVDVNAAAHACRGKFRKMLQRVPCAPIGACVLRFVAHYCAFFLRFVKTAQTFSANIYARKINEKRCFFRVCKCHMQGWRCRYVPVPCAVARLVCCFC